jgi:hypothetical protein
MRNDGAAEAITDLEARNKVLATINAARKVRSGVHGSFVVTDWTKAKWLARGERAACIVGGLANSVVYSPAWARADIGWDRLLFYGPTGVLCHEEPAHQLEMRNIEVLNELLDADEKRHAQ